MQQIGSVIVLVALVVAGMFLVREEDRSALPATPSFESISVPFTTLLQGDQSKVAKRVNYLVTSDEGLKELWSMLGTKSAMPKVDFNTRSVVAVFAGEQATGGHSIAVAKIEDSASARTVSVALTAPGEGCMSAQVITAPFQVVELPSTELEFTHKDTQVAVACE